MSDSDVPIKPLNIRTWDDITLNIVYAIFWIALFYVCNTAVVQGCQNHRVDLCLTQCAKTAQTNCIPTCATYNK